MRYLRRLHGAVLTLLSGTAFAQLVLFAASPLLTRLYEPAVFGQYAMLSFALSLLVVFSTGKYEIAVLLPKSDDDAWALAWLAGSLALSVSVLGAFGATVWVMVAEPQLFNLQGGTRFALVALAGVMVVLSGWQSTLFVWMNRAGKYRSISAGRILQAVIMVGAQILFAHYARDVFGLLLGTVFGLLGCVVLQLIVVVRSRGVSLPQWDRLIHLAKVHWNLPIHTIPTDLIGTLLAQFPVYFLGMRFSESTVGLYSLAQRTLLAPMQLISNSVGEVFRRQASAQYTSDGRCDRYFCKTVFGLALIALIAVLIVLALGPDIFAIVFGENWRPAGDFSRIMIFMFALKFIVSPVSFMFIIAGRTKIDFWLHLLFLIALVGGFEMMGNLLDSVSKALLLFVAIYSLMYLLYLALSYRFARGMV